MIQKCIQLIICTRLCLAFAPIYRPDRIWAVCANEIITKYFDVESYTSFISASDDMEGQFFMSVTRKMGKHCVFVYYHDHDKTFRDSFPKTSNVVIFIKEVSRLQELFEDMKEHNFSIHSRFLITARNADQDEYFIKDIVNTCWKYKILNVLIMVKDISGIKIYNYNPFTYGKCDVPEITLVGTCDGNKSYLEQDLYKNKAKNLNGCPIRLSTKRYVHMVIVHKQGNGSYTLSGVEGMLWNIIIKKLNSSLKISHLEKGWAVSYKNRKYSGSLGKLQTDEADAAIGVFQITPRRLEYFRSSTSYFTEYILIAYSLEKPVGIWKRLYAPLQPTVWLCILFTLPVFFYVARFKIPAFGLNNSLDFVALFLGYPVAPPRTRTFKIFHVSFLVFLFAMIIRTSYQSNLIFFLSGDWRETGPKRISDFKDQGYKCAIVKTDSFSETIWQQLGVRDFMYFETYGAVIKAMNKGDEKLMTGTNRKILKNYRGLPRKVAPEIIYMYNLALFFQKTSPYVEAIDEIIQRAQSHGLIEKLFREYSPNDPVEDFHKGTLGLQELCGSFYVLFIGLSLSVLVFVGELLHHKFWSSKR